MNSPVKKIVFIGAGKVATALAKALPKEYRVVQVYSKTIKSAKELSALVKSAYTNKLSEISTEADIYILAVKDDAIADVASKLRLKNKLVLHTSGSVDINVLMKSSSTYGVIWPLQSFSKGTVLKNKIPFCIDGSSKSVVKHLQILVKELGGVPYYISADKRNRLHLAAVFANNFTNHLYGIAYHLLKKEKLPFEMLIPIIEETVEKLKNGDPFKNQTGPAIRRDKKTIAKHEKLLSDNKDYLKVYNTLTRSIQTNHAKEL